MTKDKAPGDVQELTELVAMFNASTRQLQETHDRLRSQIAELSTELARKNRELSARIDETSALKDYLAGILDSITEGVIAVGPGGEIRAVNPAVATILPGLWEGRVVGRTLRSQLGSWGAELAGLVDAVLGGGRQVAEQELTLTLPGGQQRILAVSVSMLQPVAGEEGAGAVCTFRDLTRVKQLEEVLQRRERLAALGEMAAGVAHEIRNPLGGIELNASLLQRGLEGKQKELSGKVLVAATRLNRIVSDMLTFTRQRDLHLSPVRIEAAVEPAIDALTRQASERGVRVERHYQPPGARALMDPDLMQQAVENLIANAIQFSPEGGVVRIAAGSRQHPDAAPSLFVDVADTGPGVPPDVGDRIFNPFFSLRDGGTGLGLAIAHKLVADHGGQLAVRDNQPTGAVFTILLKAPPADA